MERVLCLSATSFWASSIFEMTAFFIVFFAFTSRSLTSPDGLFEMTAFFDVEILHFA
jgi:hypothetical protein